MAETLPPLPTYVDDAKSLERWAAEWADETAIAVDCEANPLFAYREQLCLLQISTIRGDYVIDPLAGFDLAPLAPIFADPAILKVFHSGDYDVMLLKRTYPFEVRGLFDTKVAAVSLGSRSPGLAAVLELEFGVEIDKKHQRSDWGRRPLSDAQLDYARRDTCYLLELADLFRDRLAEAGSPHVEEVAAECRRLESLEPDPRPFDADDYLKIKGANSLDPGGLSALRELSLMRHEIARERDQPLFKVLGNEMLLDLAHQRPDGFDKLAASRILSGKLNARYGQAVVTAIREAARNGPIRKQPATSRDPEDLLNSVERQRYDGLRRWRKLTAQSRSTDASLILGRAAMFALAKFDPVPRDEIELGQTGVLETWRVSHYGRAILKALRD